jgi:general secretion pathway protein G
MKKQMGFSMLEVMVVIAIIGIMMGVMVPVFMGNDDKARVSAAKQDIDAIATALDLYKLDNRRYPTTDQGLDALVTPPDNAVNWAENGYLKKLKTDPWGNPYQYLSPGSSGPYELFSLGADGIEGGEGYGSDISYADI